MIISCLGDSYVYHLVLTDEMWAQLTCALSRAWSSRPLVPWSEAVIWPVSSILEMEEQALHLGPNTMKNLAQLMHILVHFFKFVWLFKPLLFWFSVRRSNLNRTMLLIVLHFRNKCNILFPNTYFYNIFGELYIIKSVHFC